MKVALVHDYIKEYGGAERVLEALHELYPDAPVYTSVYLPEFLGPHAIRFAGWDIRTSFLQSLPFKEKLISPFRLFSKKVFKSFNFSSYDLIISSATGAYFPNSLNKKKAKLICYCHTPPRYLYGYATAREWKKNPVINAAATVANHFLRMSDFNAAQNVDQFVANSEEVAGRIKKFYRKEAIVVYPPVEVDLGLKIKDLGLKKREYYLTGGRLARAKHNELPIKACRELGATLKVFGKGFGGYESELREIAKGKGERGIEGAKDQRPRTNDNVEFVGEVSDSEKIALMAGAKAFLYASEDEDFGIIPVESMACGTPVIAYESGGLKETVVDGKTGLFFDELSVKSLVEAMKKFEKMKFDPEACRKQAEKFGKDKFMKKMKGVVLQVSSSNV